MSDGYSGNACAKFSVSATRSAFRLPPGYRAAPLPVASAPFWHEGFMYDALYLVHDLSDAAVRQRTRMLREAGVAITVAGFNRAPADAFPDLGATVIDLGPSHAGRLIHRAAMTIRNWLDTAELRRRLPTRPQVIIARNLEMLVVAARLRRQVAPRARIVFECLDIHGFMMARCAHGSLLRRLERHLLDQCDLVVVSSPDYQHAYFKPVQRWTGPTLLVENKFYPPDGFALDPARQAPPPGSGPPWTIGWFGMIRCAEGLRILERMQAALPGVASVFIAGRPSEALQRQIAGLPAAADIRFLGPYLPDDLPALVRRTHFVWSIDFFHRDFNSQVLLPNRLYSSCLFGSVPVVVGATATGRWLQRHRAGIHLKDDCSDLEEVMKSMSASRYQEETERVRAIDCRQLAWDADGCRELAKALITDGVPASQPVAVRWL